MRAVPQACIDLVRASEGLRLESYQDPAGVWTIGWGSTKGVHAGMRITEAAALARLQDDLADARAALYGIISLDLFQPAPAGLTDQQYAALIDFAYNVGTQDKSTGKIYTLYTVVNKRQFDQVPQWLAKYVYAGGKKLNGLVTRRNAEIALWSTAEPGASDENPPSSYVREEQTPPAVTDPTPVHKQPGFVASCVAAACAAPAALGGAVKQATDAIIPYAGTSPLVGKVVQHLAEVGAAAAVATVAVLWLQHRQPKV